MHHHRIIPCLDLHEGRIVKGVQFSNLQDAGDPIERAALYAREGADELFLLDIAALGKNRRLTLKLVESITTAAPGLPVTVGGGIDRTAVMEEMLQWGATKVSIGSAALENPALLAEGARLFGSSRIVVAIDTRRSPPDNGGSEPRWEVYSRGGRQPTGRDAALWAREAEQLGAGEILLTSMDADGTGEGYDLALLKMVTGGLSIPVIASGGAGTLEHLYKALAEGGADAVLIASMLHQDRCSIGEIKRFLKARSLPVRGANRNGRTI